MSTGKITSGTYSKQSNCPDLASFILKLRLPIHSLNPIQDPGVNGRGDELREAGEFHQLAKIFENCRQRLAASNAEAKAREMVAKELNELDGFDR